MSVLTSRPRLRWLAPVAVALAVLAGGAAVGAVTAAVDRSLPARDAEQILVDLQTARPDGLSGTIVYQADLGLPDLPFLSTVPGGDQGPSLASLVAGTHTLRVWYAAPDQARVALLGTLGETDIITNGRDLWIWESKQNRATHRTLPSRPGTAPGSGPTPGALPGSLGAFGGMTPQQVARLALTVLGPTTDVTTDGSASVAGRPAYELVLTPRDAATLVGSVRLAVDAEEHVPLRVQVFGRGHAEPVLEVAFTEVSFDRPAPAQFVFNPPPGAEIIERGGPGDAQVWPGHSWPGRGLAGLGSTDPGKPGDRKPGERGSTEPGSSDHEFARPPFAMVGSGWSAVVVVRPPAGEGLEALRGLLPPAPDGGAILTSRLFSVLITEDGRVLFGAVPGERLTEAADDPAAQLPS